MRTSLILRYLLNTLKVSSMVKTMSLRLPDDIDEKLRKAIEKGRAITKTELIRRAIAEFIERHQEIFS
jgi:predicted transcriptional regulator